ncbi:flagellar biosynthesis protein FlgL [Erythrobacter sp. SCSIO 43205]|uniref:flagellin N-terminal helical domain-containing protein n=1 Tax=Erythrobacter sp. SCSIO 43205 TaxID=2779361 RepID=UPI001CA98DF9|nr:flagellar biosynthesis protein FlgL [Erythrobacter sp. SCSIO 43205]UAB78731.1 flagellar biosynthesis protein FlgL [Erythrobacter sp. SCSIO 43205]
MSFVSNSTGAFYERSLGQLAVLRESAEEFQTQIATGVRIQRGSEDPVAASRLRQLTRLEVRGETEQENAARLRQDLEETSNQIGGVVELIQRARELAIQAANDTQGENGRAAIADELEQMADELFTRSNAISITGAPLFAGTAGAPAFTRAPDGTVTYAGNGQVGTVPVAPGTDIERGITGDALFEFDVAGTPTSSFEVFSTLADELRTGTDPQAAAQTALSGLDEALNAANRNQTIVGTRAAWVEAIEGDQAIRSINIAEKRSEIGDTNLADVIVRLQQTLTALEASQTTFTRVSNLTLFNAL